MGKFTVSCTENCQDDRYESDLCKKFPLSPPPHNKDPHKYPTFGVSADLTTTHTTKEIKTSAERMVYASLNHSLPHCSQFNNKARI
jgi:hypothetical protein